MTPEGRVLAAFTKGLRSHGVEYLRLVFRPGVASGWPDVLVPLSDGGTAWVEMKAPGGKLAPLQELRVEYLRGLGHVVYVVDNVAGAKSLAADLAAKGLPKPGG